MAYRRSLANVVGFDDAPFDRTLADAGEIALVGAVCAGTRLDVLVRGHVRHNGDDATAEIERLVKDPALEHVRGIQMKGVTCAGFNVVDIHGLHERTGLPVLVVLRRLPRWSGFFHALGRVPNFEQKQKLVERCGEPEKLDSLYVQRAGLSLAEARRMLEKTTIHGHIPEPLRLAHIIAGGMTTGRSRGAA